MFENRDEGSHVQSPNGLLGLAVLVFVCSAVGCEQSMSEPARPPLPAGFIIEGSAIDTADGWTVECAIYGRIEAVRPTPGGWVGQMSGEVMRRFADAAGAGTEFRAVVGDPDFSVRYEDGVASLAFAGPPEVHQQDLWILLGQLEAEETDAWYFHGTWRGGPPSQAAEPEPRTVIEGTWSLVPATAG